MKLSLQAKQTKFTVNKEARELNDVIVLAIGEADGHGVQITEQTLVAFLAVVGSKQKVRIAHPIYYEADKPLSAIGYCADFYRDGIYVKAKALKLLPAFSAQEEADYAKLMAMAEQMPETFGLSIVFKYDEVAIDGQLPTVVPTKVYAVDIVSDPAATPSLFAAKEDEENIGFFGKLKSWLDKKEELDAAKIELASAKDEAAKALKASQDEAQAKFDKAVADLSAEKTALATKLAEAEAELSRLRDAAKLNDNLVFSGKLPTPKDTTQFQENPFMPGASFNETKQAVLRLNKPELARTLESEAKNKKSAK